MDNIRNIWKPEIGRLNSEELAYELSSRGLPGGTVDDMRKSVRNLFRGEADKSLVPIDYTVPFDDDIAAIRKGVAELEASLVTFTGITKSSEFDRIAALLSYLVRRFDRIVPPTVTDTKMEYNKMMLKLCNIRADYEDKILSTVAPPVVPAPLTPINVPMTTSTPTGAIAPVNLSNFPPCSASPKYVSVAKWNIYFDGESNSSLNTFLEQIEELCTARNVSKSQLFSSITDLLKGRALWWFRSIRDEVSNWSELVQRLKTQFLPCDYEDKIKIGYKERMNVQPYLSPPCAIYLSVLIMYLRRHNN